MMAALKVARIISGLWWGGVEKKLAALLPLLVDRGLEMHVICLRKEGELAPQLREKGITVQLCRVPSRWSPSGLKNLRNWLIDHGIQIVHTHMYRANTSGTAAARWAKVPVVVSQIHNVDTWDHRRQIWTDRAMIRFKDAVVFVSEEVRRNYTQTVHVPESKQVVIHNGVDTRFFTPGDVNANPMNLRGRIRIGAMARLMPQKGIRHLVDVAADPQIREMDVRVFVLGDGPLREELESLAREKHADNFTILGYRDDVLDFLRSIHVFAMPSYKEGFSNALMEAMATAKPVVVTAVGGNPEAVRDGEEGFLVPAGDGILFKERLLQLCGDEHLRLSMGEAARRRAEVFSLDEMARKTVELYKKLADEKGVVYR